MYEEHKIISARYIKRGKRECEPFHHHGVGGAGSDITIDSAEKPPIHQNSG